MTDAAITATFAEFKMVKTRECLQLIFEAPLQDAPEIFKALGYPVPGKERWFAIAALALDTAKPEVVKSEGVLARERAVMLCEDARFRHWASEIDPEVVNSGAANWLRKQIGANSRSSIATDPAVLKRFLVIEAQYREETGLQTRRR